VVHFGLWRCPGRASRRHGRFINDFMRRSRGHESSHISPLMVVLMMKGGVVEAIRQRLVAQLVEAHRSIFVVELGFAKSPAVELEVTRLLDVVTVLVVLERVHVEGEAGLANCSGIVVDHLFPVVKLLFALLYGHSQ